MGLDAGVEYQVCSSAKGHETESVMSKAKKAGKQVGFVTTTYVNHASPSGLYAHRKRDYTNARFKLSVLVLRYLF